MLDGCDTHILCVLKQLHQEAAGVWTFTLPEIVLRTGLPHGQVLLRSTTLAERGYLTSGQGPAGIPRYGLCHPAEIPAAAPAL